MRVLTLPKRGGPLTMQKWGQVTMPMVRPRTRR
jgi:hypothetical protein